MYIIVVRHCFLFLINGPTSLIPRKYLKISLIFLYITFFYYLKKTINAFQFKIPEKNPGNSYFALSINEMQINVSYLHCLVIYQDVTELINSAKMLIDDDVIECFQPRSEQKEGYILNPVEIKRNQAKYFYPFNFVIKTKSQHHRFFRKVLEELAKILEENPFPYKDLVFYYDFFSIFR